MTEMRSGMCASHQGNWPSAAPTPRLQQTPAVSEAQAVPPKGPTHQGCRPGQFSSEAEGQKEKLELSLMKALPTCEQGVDCRLEI